VTAVGPGAPLGDTRAMRRLALPLVLVCVAGLAREAAADVLPAGKAFIMHSYGVDNVAEFPDHIVLEYPIRCDRETRKAVGVGSHDSEGVAYDVIFKGTEHARSPDCDDSQIYVVERAGLTVEAPEPINDGYFLPAKITELMPLEGEALAAFFASDPRVHATGYHVGRPRDVVPEDSTPLRGVHLNLRLERLGEGFALSGATVEYRYADQSEETLVFVTREPPTPSGKGIPKELPPAPLRMLSEVPRWPFIAGACGVFLIMALLGLRRRRA
jgi:hypothetical protein